MKQHLVFTSSFTSCEVAIASCNWTSKLIAVNTCGIIYSKPMNTCASEIVELIYKIQTKMWENSFYCCVAMRRIAISYIVHMPPKSPFLLKIYNLQCNVELFNSVCVIYAILAFVVSVVTYHTKFISTYLWFVSEIFYYQQ